MAEQMQFAIGAKASCSDGPCGELRRMIVDPADDTITHLVIESKHRQLPGRLVPVDLVDSAAGEIRLRCTIAEFDRLEPAEERELVEGPGLGIGGPVGMTPYAGIPTPALVVEQDIVPVGEAQLGPGEPVHALDGEIGQVQGFLVDPSDRRVTHVLLREGHLWGRKEVAIPVSAVTGVREGIRLNMTKQQVEQLPPIHIDRSS
jgi:hypothetical protein